MLEQDPYGDWCLYWGYIAEYHVSKTERMASYQDPDNGLHTWMYDWTRNWGEIAYDYGDAIYDWSHRNCSQCCGYDDYD